MKILVISQYYYPEPFKVNEICEGLVKEGHKVTVITGMPNYPSGKLYEGYENKMHEYKDGVEIIRTNIVLRGKNPLSMIANYYSYPRKAKQAIDKLEDEYDIVYVYQLSPIMMIQPAVYYKQKYGKKILTYCLDLWPESLSNIKIKKNNPIYSYILSVANKLYAKCDHIMVTSPFFLEYLNQVNKVESDKLSINYQHGEDFFLEVPKYEKKEKFNLTFAGNIGKAQGLNYLIKAIQCIPKEYLNQLEVTIIGSGSYLEELKNEVQRYKLDSIIEFVGRVQPKELIPYYEKASMLYLSLDKESKISNTIPTKLQSYFAAGRGVLACIDGETSNIIKQANAGLSCPAGDYESLSKLIIQCLKDENQNAIKAYSVNTRKYFMEHFKLEKHISILTNKMEELVK